MWQDAYGHENMMDWDGAWYWLMSFHGLFFLISLAVIVLACAALYRDWRRDQSENQGWRKPDINNHGNRNV